MGYDVIPQVGCSGYRIDLAVVDPDNPGRFILGVECDGATYHSAHSARDRDRTRQMVLEKLGWRIHRIWAPSWVTRREEEVERLRKAIEKARKSGPTYGKFSKKAEKGFRHGVDQKERKRRRKAVDTNRKQGSSVSIGVPYKVSRLKPKFEEYITVPIRRRPYYSTQKNEFHLPTNREEQCRLLTELVKKEGPIHFEYAVKRLAKAWGLKRVGVRVKDAVQEAVERCASAGHILVRDNILKI